MKIVLLEKEYSSESLCDAERDVYECWENNTAAVDEHGFTSGAYKITITYEE